MHELQEALNYGLLAIRTHAVKARGMQAMNTQIYVLLSLFIDAGLTMLWRGERGRRPSKGGFGTQRIQTFLGVP